MRLVLGFSFGAVYGMYQWGDIQRLHNAYVAERITRRYPESIKLSRPNLFEVVNEEPKHLFYKWT